MRKVMLIGMLTVISAASIAVAKSAVVAVATTESSGLPAVYDQVIAPTCSGGPPGTDEIRYDQGGLCNGWYFYDIRSKYAVRMDPAYYPAIVAQCDVQLIPDAHHDSIYVEIWLDQNGDGMPDFPAVWAAWAQGSDSAPDSAAVTVPVPLGQVICYSGSFWVSMMMDTVHGGLEVVADDSAPNYPDHLYYYYPPSGVWFQGSYFNTDLMIRSWTMRQGVRGLVAEITAPLEDVFAGDTSTPGAHIANLGTASDSSWVWMRIEKTDSSDSYVDSCWVRLDPLQTLDTTYRAWSPYYAGIYRMQCTTERNDTSWTYLTVLAREGVGASPLPSGLAGNGIEVGPNPVRNAAAIRYGVTVKSRVEIRILDVRGTVVRTLVAGCSAPGEHLAVWDARDDQGRPSPRGVYFVRLQTLNYGESRKLILVQ